MVFEVKKQGYFAPYKIGSIDFESSLLKSFAPQKVEASNV